MVKEAPCPKRVPTAIIAALETNKRGFLRLACSSPNWLIGFNCCWFPGSDQVLYIKSEGERVVLWQQSALRAAAFANWDRGHFFLDLNLNDVSADGKLLLVCSPGTRAALNYSGAGRACRMGAVKPSP